MNFSRFMAYMGRLGLPIKGDKGDPGPQGPAGPQGVTGAQGPIGITGATGAIGATGQQGPIGLTGANGATGSTGAKGADGVAGKDGATGVAGPKGDQGIQGVAGTAGTNATANPSARTTRTIAVGTAYQALNPAKPAFIVITFSAPGALSLTGGTTIIGDIRAGSTAAIANSNGGALIADIQKKLTGGLSISLNIQTEDYETKSFMLAPNEYFAVRQLSGSGLAIISTTEQAIG